MVSAPIRYWVSGVFVPADQLVALARHADQLGFEGLSLPDHSAMPATIRSPYPGGDIPWALDSDWADVWVMIGAMASTTTRLRFVTNVYVLPLRHPLVVARALNTAAVVSQGRVVLGVGVGWMAEEFGALGQDFTNRGERADEAIEILRTLGRGGPAAHHGRWYDFEELHLRPASPMPTQIWVGGESEAALRRAATLGDGWITEYPAAAVESHVERLAELREAAGRSEPFAVAVAAVAPPDDHDLARYARLGVEHVKVQPWRFEGADDGDLAAKLRALDRFAERYLAAG